MRAGGKVILCDNLEQEHHAIWEVVSRSECRAIIDHSEHKEDISSSNPVHLYVPPLKNQNRWELILEKGTEIGVASFIPLITKRTEVDELRKPERLHRIIKEAAEQSGRTKLPELASAMSFEQLLELCGPNMPTSNAMGFIASLEEDSMKLTEAIRKEREKREMTKLGCNILIGPVGDFTEEELQQAKETGFIPFTLGKQILRTETAAIVSAALALAC